MSSYISIVNNVLSRLREAQVTTVSQNAYSLLIGTLVNDTKRSVEDAWNWNALYQTLTIATVANTHTYTITGAGYRLKVDTVNNGTSKGQLQNVPLSFILGQQQLATVSNGTPKYYAFNAVSSGDVRVTLFPTPDGVATISFNGWVPQVALSEDADLLVIPSESVMLGAYARALVERGEDGGLASSEAYQLYTSTLSDQIAIEAGRHAENSEWGAV